MKFYRDQLEQRLAEAHKRALQYVAPIAGVLYPGQESTTKDVLDNMPQRYSETIESAPEGAVKISDAAIIGWQLHGACNLIERIKLLPDIDGLNERELVIAYRFFMAGVYYGIIEGRDPDLFESLKPVMHGELQSEARKHGHVQENKIRQQLLDSFEKYVRGRVAGGYRGSAAALVRFALNQAEFGELKAATEAKTDTNSESPKSGQITKRAFVGKKRLEGLTRSILRNTPEK